MTTRGRHAAADDDEPAVPDVLLPDPIEDAEDAAIDPADGLASKTGAGLGWSALSRVAIQVVQFGTTAVLARLIAPAQFGVVALVLVFVAFAAIFSDLGLGSAVVHERDPDVTYLSTAFWINAVTGVVMSAVMIALSPLIAAFFGQPSMVLLMIIVSCSYTVSLFVVHAGLLQREFRFRAIGIIELLAVVVYSGLALVLAVLGLGAKALVIASLVQTAVTTLLYWSVLHWRPRFVFSGSAARSIWQYSSGLVGFNVLNYWTRNLDNLVVGRFTTPTTLAFYSRAYNLMMLPVNQLNVIVGRVLFPALAALRDDPPRLRRAYVRVLKLMVGVACPISAGLAAAAPAAVDTIYGNRWGGVAPLLTALAISGPPQFIASTCGPLYQALGRTGPQFRRSLWTALGTAIAVFAGLPWGALGVAVALTIRFYVLTPITTSGVWPAVGLSLRQGMAATRGPFLAGLLSAAAALVVRVLLRDQAAPLVLVVQVVATIGVYAAALVVLDRQLAADIWRLASTRLRRSARAEPPVTPDRPESPTAQRLEAPPDPSP